MAMRIPNVTIPCQTIKAERLFILLRRLIVVVTVLGDLRRDFVFGSEEIYYIQLPKSCGVNRYNVSKIIFPNGYQQPSRYIGLFFASNCRRGRVEIFSWTAVVMGDLC